jgi:hypothetical protein
MRAGFAVAMPARSNMKAASHSEGGPRGPRSRDLSPDQDTLTFSRRSASARSRPSAKTRRSRAMPKTDRMSRRDFGPAADGVAVSLTRASTACRERCSLPGGPLVTGQSRLGQLARGAPISNSVTGRRGVRRVLRDRPSCSVPVRHHCQASGARCRSREHTRPMRWRPRSLPLPAQRPCLLGCASGLDQQRNGQRR